MFRRAHGVPPPEQDSADVHYEQEAEEGLEYQMGDLRQRCIDVATALADAFRVNKATIAMVQLMGSDGSSTHCVSVVSDVRHDEVRYIVVDSNDRRQLPRDDT